MDNKGCVTFIFTMSTFTKVSQKVLRDDLQIRAKVEEEGTGKSYNILYHIYMKKRENYTAVLWNSCCNVEASCTGISRQQEQRITISYVVGKLSFTDTPKIYDKGSNVEGKVRACGLHFFVVILDAVHSRWLCAFQQVQAVHYNNTPIPNMPLYLFEGERRSSRRLQNLTTNNDGVATFSFSTAELNGDIQLHVSKK